MIIPPCQDHPDLSAKVVTTLPEGYQNMSPAMIDFYKSVSCGECGRVLKPTAAYKATDAAKSVFGQHIEWVTHGGW